MARRLSPGERLERMMSWIRTYGWTQGKFHGKGGRTDTSCLVGAGASVHWQWADKVALAHVILEQWPDRVNELNHASDIERFVNPFRYSLQYAWRQPPERVRAEGARGICMAFNDHPRTTEHDVLLACDKARAHREESV